MTAGKYVLESSTTGDIKPHERTDFWNEHVAALHCRLEQRYQRAEDFVAGTTSQRTESYQLIEFWSEAIEYTRTPHQVRSDPDPDYRLLIPLEGRLTIRQHGQEEYIAKGSAGLVALGKPFQLLHGSGTRALIMTVPARAVDDPLNRLSPLSAGFDLTTGLGRVVGQMVQGLHEERAAISGRQFDAVSDRVVELVCMLAEGDDRAHVPGHLPAVEQMVRRHVRSAAGDPGLNGAALARAVGWSLRQVQLALQQAGTTPRDLIREERLRLVRERLESPACRHLTITEIAHASGFTSPSALSTAFRRRYGMTPRDARRAASELGVTAGPAAGAAVLQSHRTPHSSGAGSPGRG